MEKREFDVIVVGSGPNGLSAAITAQKAGLSVLLLEAKNEIGGGLRTEEITLPGFKHDICSAIHPMASISPFLNSVSLESYGLEFNYPEFSASHPFEDGTIAVLTKSVSKTAELLGVDRQAYLKLLTPILDNWHSITKEVLAPLHIPAKPFQLAHFGLKAIRSAESLSKLFVGQKAKGLWAGMAAHSIQPLSNTSTSAIGLILMAAGHINGWPIPVGGSRSIARALGDYFVDLGGTIECNTYVKSLSELPSSHAVLFDVTPQQLLKIAGHKFSKLYQWQLNRYRHGMGVFKVDWALDGPIPFKAAEATLSGTVHLGNSFEEIAYSEKITSKGKHPDRPFVLLAQQSRFDRTRTPEGKEAVWAYCHVPNGSEVDMTDRIENQIERFAPGFKDRILEKHTMNTSELEVYNPNYIGGDINGGIIDIGQLFTRPALRLSPYKTSAKGLYICSSSTPPGPGVHGMCGYFAAKTALKQVFNIDVELTAADHRENSQ